MPTTLARATFARPRNLALMARYGSFSSPLGRVAYGIYRRRATIARIRQAVRTGKRVYRGVSRVAMATHRRKRRKFSPTNIGDAPGSTSASKKFLSVDEHGVTKDTRTMYEHNLFDVAKGTAENTRERATVKISGMKICMQVRNKDNNPMYLNMAMVSTKSGDSGTGIQLQDFFRSSGASRGRDFSDPSLTGQEMHCLPINADKYIILFHRRYLLGPTPLSTTFSPHTGRPNYKNFDFYQKINRQISYDADTATRPETGQVHFIYWFSPYEMGPGSAVQTNVAEASIHGITYFRDIN